jgi:fimbrial chaperone protein
MLKMHSRAAAITAALFLCAAGPAALREAHAAAQFSIEPLMLTLPAGKLATSLTLGNTGAAPVTVQAEIAAWNQENGEDALVPVDELVVSPPIFKLEPGARQVVRVGRLKRAIAPAREGAYRIKLTEVPPQATDNPKPVATFMQLSLPVFVPPAKRQARPALEFDAGRQAGGALRLAFANPGLVHDKVTRVAVIQDGKTLAERSLNYYVLAGAKRTLDWPGALKAAKPGPIEIQVRLDGRNRTLTRIVAPPANQKN